MASYWAPMRVVIKWVTVFPSTWIYDDAVVSRTFYMNMWTENLQWILYNDSDCQSWSTDNWSVTKIERIWTAKLKWTNKLTIMPRSVVPIWSIWRWTFLWMHIDWTLKQIPITWITSTITEWTITPWKFVWYLTMTYNDVEYKVPYYS